MTLNEWKAWIEESQMTFDDVIQFTQLQDDYCDARRNHQLLHLFYHDNFEQVYGEWGRECRKNLAKAEDRLKDNKFYQSLPKKI